MRLPCFFTKIFAYVKYFVYFCSAKQKFCRIEPTLREYVFRVGNIQDILKKASYALCFGWLESGKFINSKTLQHKMSMVCIYIVCAYRVPFMIYIRRGLRVACSELKAIPEP